MSGVQYKNEEGETAATDTRTEDNTSTESNCSQAVDDTDPPPPYGCIFRVSSPQSNEEDKVERIGPKMADEKVNKNFTGKCEDLASDVGQRIETCAMKVGHYIENYASHVGHRIENFACPGDRPSGSKG